jgi:DUF4097 and DUF4098 domain-containing protein YvlB
MRRLLGSTFALVLAAAPLSLTGCTSGSAATGSFTRTLSVSGPLRIEIGSASGEVQVTGSSDGQLHIRGEARSTGFPFGDPKKRLDEIIANPPIEQSGDTIRIGKDLSSLRDASISYTIETPHDTELDIHVASGAQTIRNVKGPVKVDSASGSVHIEKVDREVSVNSASGTVDLADIGDDAKVASASGSVTVSVTKGDVDVKTLSGSVRIVKPGGRVTADNASGSIDVQGAMNDVRAGAMSGRIAVQGNPVNNAYWDLKTASGGVEISVPANANFRLTADAVSGEIRTQIPIVVEEQSKRSLRAHVGTGGGRIELHTVSGPILVKSY